MATTTRPYLPAAGHAWLLPLYDPLTRLLRLDRIHRRLVELAEIRPGQRVLEIGCGRGSLTILIKQLHANADVVGLDPDPGALARARRKADRRGVSIEWRQGSSEDLPYPDGAFHHVCAAFMLHHLERDEKTRALEEIRRVLTRAGSVHVVDFDRSHGHSDGLLARLLHRSERLRDNVGEIVVRLMRDAGLSDPRLAAHESTILGRVAFYHATRA